MHRCVPGVLYQVATCGTAYRWSARIPACTAACRRLGLNRNDRTDIGSQNAGTALFSSDRNDQTVLAYLWRLGIPTPPQMIPFATMNPICLLTGTALSLMVVMRYRSSETTELATEQIPSRCGNVTRAISPGAVMSGRHNVHVDRLLGVGHRFPPPTARVVPSA